MRFSQKQSASLMLGSALLLSGATWLAAAPEPSAGHSLLVSAAVGQEAESVTPGAGVVAGLGIVEPASGTVDLSPMMAGVIVSVLKDEGDKVARSEIVAEMANEDLKALVAQAESSVRLEAARLALTEKGPRREEIAQAEAKVREEQSNIELFDIQLQRRQALVRQGAIARELLNEAQRSMANSRERMAAAGQQLDILRQGSRPEEIEAARASFKLAQDKLAEAQATLNKSYVRSPTDGVVLRRFMEPGEAVLPDTAGVIMQIADTSRLVVRTQIDENDISGLKIGQHAEISAPSLGGKQLSGTVSRISPRLGAKTVTAELPDEKRDTRVLDVIVALDPGVSLHVNLRVDVVISLAGGVDPVILKSIAETPLRLALSEFSCLPTACSHSQEATEGQTAEVIDREPGVEARSATIASLSGDIPE